jgi:tRNA A-37 threonylcarbamoyl transferase component Bud32
MTNPNPNAESSKNVYTKHGVELHEYEMQKYVYSLDILNVPRIISYNKKKKIMVMEQIKGDSISDYYGEEPGQVPLDVFERVREIIKTLVLNEIEYPDITGYNFIMDEDGELWVIDFEHALHNQNIKNRFIKGFCSGKNKWNPLFQ